MSRARLPDGSGRPKLEMAGDEASGTTSKAPDPARPASPRGDGGSGRRWLLARLRSMVGDREFMILVALLIGIGGGIGAVFFRYLIELFQDLAWGSGGTPLDKVLRAPWYWRLSVPAAGGLLVGLIVKFAAPEAKGHGVPEVMHAVARSGGVIRPVVVLAKSVASAICIAAGGSVGREGPIVQVGAAIGSTLGQWMHLSTSRIRTCVGCGAAAGIAATFNAPIAGAFFASEIILGEFTVGAFSSVVVSSVAATVLARIVLGDVPAFEIPTYTIVHPAEMINYAALGIAAGFAGVAFVFVLHYSEDLFERLRAIPSFLQPVIGGLGIGALGIVLPEVMGVGYDTITAALHDDLAVGLLVLLLVAKLAATSFTLGSGGSGGVFAPSLFMGAALGGGIGWIANAIMPFPVASPGAYAVVGMGAMVAAATHAPITAILIIFELTGDYRVILGLMVSCVIGTILAQRLRRESIYTIKLVRRGINLMAGREANVLRQIEVKQVMRTDVETVRRTTTVDELCQRMVVSPHYEFFVVDDQGLAGVVSVDDLRKALPDLEGLRHLAIANDIMTTPPIYLREDETLDVAMLRFGRDTFEELPVLPSGDSMHPIGIIRRQDTINAYNKEMVKVDLGGSMSSCLSSATRFRSWETVGGYEMALMEVPPHLCDQPLQQLALRETEGVQIILIEKEGQDKETHFLLATPSTRLSPGENMVVFGKRDNIRRLTDDLG